MEKKNTASVNTTQKKEEDSGYKSDGRDEEEESYR